jgi:hypothetical protein
MIQNAHGICVLSRERVGEKMHSSFFFEMVIVH